MALSKILEQQAIRDKLFNSTGHVYFNEMTFQQNSQNWFQLRSLYMTHQLRWLYDFKQAEGYWALPNTAANKKLSMPSRRTSSKPEAGPRWGQFAIWANPNIYVEGYATGQVLLRAPVDLGFLAEVETWDVLFILKPSPNAIILKTYCIADGLIEHLNTFVIPVCYPGQWSTSRLKNSHKNCNFI